MYDQLVTLEFVKCFSTERKHTKQIKQYIHVLTTDRLHNTGIFCGLL